MILRMPAVEDYDAAPCPRSRRCGGRPWPRSRCGRSGACPAARGSPCGTAPADGSSRRRPRRRCAALSLIRPISPTKSPSFRVTWKFGSCTVTSPAAMKYMESGGPPTWMIFSPGSATTARSRLPSSTTAGAVERGEERHALDHLGEFQAEIERRPLADGAAPLGELLAQVVVDLAADDALAQAAIVLGRFEADGGALELARLDRFGVAGILQRQRLEGAVDRLLAVLDHRGERRLGVAAQQVGHRADVEGGKLGQHALRHHQGLEAVGQALRQHALEAEPPVQPQGQAEAEIGPRDVGQPLLVAGHALVAHAVDQPVGVSPSAPRPCGATGSAARTARDRAPSRACTASPGRP